MIYSTNDISQFNARQLVYELHQANVNDLESYFHIIQSIETLRD